MNIILLSGGSGKRLWPLSNDIRSKQFIKFLKNDDGFFESMVQRVYRQILKVDKNANIVVATSTNQMAIITNQLGEKINISIEPCKKDTYPAIALSCAYMTDVLHVDDNEPVVVCPIDSFVDDDYFFTFEKLVNCILQQTSDIALLGMVPSFPSEKYGYIIPETKKDISKVQYFKEKPTVSLAEKLIKEGALWNGGVFAFRINYLLEKAKKDIGFTNYHDLLEKYEMVDKISFDYAFVEKEKNISVIKYLGQWKDIGTWSSLIDVIDGTIIGNAIIGESCENVNIINELSIPVLANGLKDVIIASSPEGILVTNRDCSSQIKPYVDNIDQRVMFAERMWGSYQIINIEDESLTLKVVLNPGHSMNYHAHFKRDEKWIIVSGSGEVVLDGVRKKVFSGDVIEIKCGVKHTIIANAQIKLIEIQLGKEISIHDKIKYCLD